MFKLLIIKEVIRIRRVYFLEDIGFIFYSLKINSIFFEYIGLKRIF